MAYNDDQPRDDNGRWAGGDSGDAIKAAASDNNINSKVEDLIKKTKERLDKKGMSDENVYIDFEGINNAEPISRLKDSVQLRKEFGSPISTEIIFEKDRETLPDSVRKEMGYIGKSDLDKEFAKAAPSRTKISNLSIIQKYVFEKPLKNANTDKFISVVKHKDKLYVLDGNHTVAKSLLMGKESVNTKIFNID